MVNHDCKIDSHEPTEDGSACSCGYFVKAAPARGAPQEGEALDLEAIEERANRAVPGPWPTDEEGLADTIGIYFNGSRWHKLAEDVGIGEAEFIAHARQDIPALIAEVRRLRASLASPAPSGVRCDNCRDTGYDNPDALDINDRIPCTRCPESPGSPSGVVEAPRKEAREWTLLVEAANNFVAAGWHGPAPIPAYAGCQLVRVREVRDGDTSELEIALSVAFEEREVEIKPLYEERDALRSQVQALEDKLWALEGAARKAVEEWGKWSILDDLAPCDGWLDAMDDLEQSLAGSHPTKGEEATAPGVVEVDAEALRKPIRWMGEWVRAMDCDCEDGHRCGWPERAKECAEAEQVWERLFSMPKVRAALQATPQEAKARDEGGEAGAAPEGGAGR